MKKMEHENTLTLVKLKTLAQLARPLVEVGVISCLDFEFIFSNLRHVVKHGEHRPYIEPKFLTPQETAEKLSLSYSQFRTLEKQGVFPFRRRTVGSKNVRYLNTEVFKYMENYQEQELLLIKEEVANEQTSPKED